MSPSMNRIDCPDIAIPPICILAAPSCRGPAGAATPGSSATGGNELSIVRRHRSPHRMPRLRFGAFLAPHHPVGEHPMLQFRRDLDLVEQLDRLRHYEVLGAQHPLR